MADQIRTSFESNPSFESAPNKSEPGSTPGHHDPEAHPKVALPDPTGRRKFVRTNIELRVELVQPGQCWEGQTENLSPGGVFVRCDQLLAAEAPIDLVIFMPNQQRVTAHGIVRWVRALATETITGVSAEGQAGGMGIQFIRLEGGSVLGSHS